jgi:hypothetical protein
MYEKAFQDGFGHIVATLPEVEEEPLPPSLEAWEDGFGHIYDPSLKLFIKSHPLPAT